MGAGISPQGGGTRSGRRRHQPMAEINVTPFVDVMLVLLIVFMVTAPLLAVGVPVDLPKTEARPLPEDRAPLQIIVDQNGAIFLEDTETTLGELVPRLTAIVQNKDEARIYLRADEALEYGQVMQVMGVVNAAGFRKVALVTDTK